MNSRDELFETHRLVSPGDQVGLDREFPLLHAHHTIRDSGRIEEHNHPFSVPEHCIIRCAHTHSPYDTASDPECHGIYWRASQHALYSHRDIRMDRCMLGIPGTLLLGHSPYNNRIRLPGEVFHRHFEHRRMPRVRSQDEAAQHHEHYCIEAIPCSHATSPRTVLCYLPCIPPGVQRGSAFLFPFVPGEKG